MPNHITNHLYFGGAHKVLKELKCEHTTEAGNLDFNTIIPAPISMQITSGTIVEECAGYLLNNPTRLKMIRSLEGNIKNARFTALLKGDSKFSKIAKLYSNVEDVQKQFEMGATYNSNMEKYGCSDWYSWNSRYWDTKWNAYDGRASMKDGLLTMAFDTAWSPPVSVIAELMSLYPELSLSHSYIDEGSAFAGTALYEDGEIVSDTPPEDMAVFAEAEFGWAPYDEDEN